MDAVFIALAALAVAWLLWRFLRAYRRESARIDELIADEARWRTTAKSPDSEDGSRGVA